MYMCTHAVRIHIHVIMMLPYSWTGTTLYIFLLTVVVIYNCLGISEWFIISRFNCGHIMTVHCTYYT